MKKYISFILAVLMLFSLCACGAKDAAQAPTDPVPQQEAPKPTEQKSPLPI